MRVTRNSRRVHIDAMEFVKHIPRKEYRAGALAAAIYGANYEYVVLAFFDYTDKVGRAIAAAYYRY